jgi:hypothetical protein
LSLNTEQVGEIVFLLSQHPVFADEPSLVPWQMLLTLVPDPLRHDRSPPEPSPVLFVPFDIRPEHPLAARGTYAAARHQRAVGAEPIWRGHVARLAPSVSSVTSALTAANAGASLLRRVINPGVQARAKLQLLAQAGERGRKIAQLLLRGGEYIHFRHRSIPLTQTA